jgi:hypothetical protein
MILIILVGVFSYKDPKMIVKRRNSMDEAMLLKKTESDGVSSSENADTGVPLWEQVKTLLKNRIFMFLAFGYSAYAFTIGSLGFWGITFVEQYFHQSANTATMLMGGVTIICGLGATVAGSLISDRMMRKYVN